MRALHLHFLARYRPDGRVKIKFGPFRRTKLAGPNKGQSGQFERRPCFRRALVSRNGDSNFNNKLLNLLAYFLLQNIYTNKNTNKF